jgi:hypothetical protein
MAAPLKPIMELGIADLHRLAVELLGMHFPPLDALENEDWGRDYVLQALRSLPAQELAKHGFAWDI